MTNKITMQLEVLANAKQAEAVAKKVKKDFHDAVNPTIDPPRSSARQQANTTSTAMQGRMDSRDSNMSRGIGGLTGAEGRDFAKQAQGLGGLVHVYATFAANVFALSAAFTALSKAADVTNMTKGLDQLGASSGRALGSLSKQLVAVTDGAISMREAMTATAQASAGGMTNASILRMGEVAKQASQALGVAMPDALSRISRGITKLEPELLDEIGIMVRVDRTSQEYAASIGKTTAALTDFEKRQAFANAVLEQGEEKFGAIKLDANPYAKILASMENIAQTGLELVNKVLTPILTILSTSPTALAVAMAGVATILIKQAIPAIGSFKESLKASAENATKLSNLRSIEAKKANVAEIMNVRAQAESVAEVRIAAIDKEVAIREQVLAKSRFKEGSKTRAIFDKPAQDVTEKDFAKIETQAKIALTKGNQELADSYRIGAIRIKESAAAEIAYAKVVDKTTQSLAAKNSILSTSGQFQKTVDRENLASISRNITSRAAEVAATNSFGTAWKEAGESVKQAKLPNQFISIKDSLGKVTQVAVPAMGAMQGFWTMTKVGAVGAISAIGTAISAFMPWLAIIGLVSGVLASVYSAFATSEKQAAKFSTSLTTLSDAAENASKTLDALSSKDFAEQIDPELIQARANAFLEVAEAVTKTVKSFRDLAAARNGAENAMEWLYSLVGFGDSDKLAKAMGTGVANSLKLLSDNPEAQKAAKSALQSLLGKDVDLSAPQSIIKVLKQLDDGQLISVGTSIEGLFKKINLDINNSASRLTSFVEGVDALAKTVTEANNRLNPTDDSFKLGVGLITQSLALTKILEEGPIKAIAALNKLISDSKNLSLMPPETSENLIKNNLQLKEIQKTLGQNLKLQELAEERLAKAKTNKAEKFKSNASDTGFYARQNKTLEDAVRKQQDVVDSLRQEGSRLSSNATETIKGISETLSKDIFEAGGKRMTQSLETALTSAAVVAGGAYLSVIKGIGGDTATEEGKLRMLEISQQRSVVEATYASIQAIEKNTLALRQAAATEAMKVAMALDEGRNTAVAIARKEQDAIDREKKIQTQDPRATLKQLASKDTSKEDRDAFAAQSTFVQGLIGYKVQMAAIDAKAYASRITQMAAEEGERVKNAQRESDFLIKTATLQKSKLDNIKQIIDTYDEEIERAIWLNEKTIAGNESLKLTEEIQGRINIAKKALEDTTASEGQKTTAKGALSKAEEDQAANTTAAKQKQIDLNAKYTSTVISGEKSLAKLAQDRASVEAQTSREIKLANIENSERALKYYLSIGSISAEASARKTEELSLDKQAIEYASQKEKLAALERDSEEKTANLKRIKSAIEAGGEGNASEAAAAAAAAEANYTKQKTLVDSRNTSIIEGIKLTSAHERLLAKQNERLKESQSITESLTAVFGEMGTNLGKVGESLTSAANSMELMAKRQEALKNKGKDDGSDEYKKYIKDKTKDELTSITSVAGATKKMFSEKSAAYKVLDGIEKASHVMKLVFAAKEIAVSLGLIAAETTGTIAGEGAKTAATIAGETTRTAAKVPGIFASFMAMMGPFGAPAAALAIAAFLGSAFGGGGGGDALQQSDFAGTGQRVGADGRLQDTNYGVIGDSKATAESITASIDILNRKLFDYMGNPSSAPMLRYLEAIRNNTALLATSLGKSLLASNNATDLSGVSGGMSGNNALLNAGSGLGGAVLGGALLGGIGPSLLGILGGGLIGVLLPSLIAGMGLGTERWSQTGTGVKIGGTLGDAKASGYQTYDVDVKDWRGRNTTNKEKRDINLGTDVSRYLNETVTNFSSLMISIGKAIDPLDTTVENTVKSIGISIDTVKTAGMTDKEFGEKILADISVQFNKASATIFPWVEKFALAGEEFGSTVIRLVKDQEDLTTGLSLINNPILKLSDIVANFTRNEKIVSNFGGIDNFASSITAYYDVMFTESEKLDKKTTSVTSAMTALGYGSVTTTKQFRDLVETLDPSSELFASLVKLGPAFADVHPAIEETAKKLTALELSASKANMSIKIYQLLGKAEKALELTREKELETLDDRLKPLQKYIYALEDEQAIKDKLVASYKEQKSAIENTIKSLKTSIETLKAYKTNLLLGDKSVLDPTKKYEESKSVYEGLKAIISKTPVTDADKLAQSDALSKLPAASDAFLGASRVMFASSAQYTADFKTVTDFVDTATVLLDAQMSDAEKQLTVLTDSYTVLNLITDALTSPDSLMIKYLASIEATTLARNNSGFVDTTTPTTSTANTTNTAPIITTTTPNATIMPVTVDNTALIAEIALLRKEVQQLRAEATTQTGHTVTAIYDANSTASTRVADAFLDSNSTAYWNRRSSVNIR